MVGVKAEVERTKSTATTTEDGEEGAEEEINGRAEWVELTVEIPGIRDDDAGTAFLAAMLSEALCADGELVRRLRINGRFHWKLFLDVCVSPLVFGTVWFGWFD